MLHNPTREIPSIVRTALGTLHENATRQNLDGGALHPRQTEIVGRSRRFSQRVNYFPSSLLLLCPVSVLNIIPTTDISPLSSFLSTADDGRGSRPTGAVDVCDGSQIRGRLAAHGLSRRAKKNYTYSGRKDVGKGLEGNEGGTGKEF